MQIYILQYIRIIENYTFLKNIFSIILKLKTLN